MPTPTRSISAGFKIDSSVGVLTDVSSWILTVAPSQNVTRIPYGTLQPDVANPIVPELAGTETQGYTLTVLYTQGGASLVFFRALKGLTGLNFSHGPDGFTAGDVKLSGLCNCITVSVPGAAGDANAVQQFTVELSCTSLNIGTF